MCYHNVEQAFALVTSLSMGVSKVDLSDDAKKGKSLLHPSGALQCLPHRGALQRLPVSLCSGWFQSQESAVLCTKNDTCAACFGAN